MFIHAQFQEHNTMISLKISTASEIVHWTLLLIQDERMKNEEEKNKKPKKGKPNRNLAIGMDNINNE